MEGFSGVIHLRAENPTGERYDLVELALVGDVPVKEGSFEFILGSREAKERRFQLGKLKSRGPQALSFGVKTTQGRQVHEYRADITLHVLERISSAREILLHAGDMQLGASSEKFNIGGVINIDVQNKIDEGQIKTANELMTEISNSAPAFKPLELESVSSGFVRTRKQMWPLAVGAAALLVLAIVVAIHSRRSTPGGPPPMNPAPAPVMQPAVQPGVGTTPQETSTATTPQERAGGTMPEQANRGEHAAPPEQPVPGVGGPVTAVPEPTPSLVPDHADEFGAREPPPALAIMPFSVLGDAAGMGGDAGIILSEVLLAAVDADQFEVLDRAQSEALLKERAIDRSAVMDNPGQAAAFGKLAGVQYIMLGSLGKLGTGYHLNVRLVDCGNGKVKERAWVSFGSMDDWQDEVPELLMLLGLRTDTVAAAASGAVHRASIDNDLINAVNAPAGFIVQIRTVDDRQTYTEGEYISFVVEASRDCHVTLITVDPEGQMTLLLPNAWQQRALVRRGEKVQIPSREAGFRFPIKPPHGETLVKAIATLKPLTLSGVTTKSIDNEKFVALKRGIKAIGVEGTPAPTQLELNGTLPDLLNPAEWSTAEFVVITRPVQEVR